MKEKITEKEHEEVEKVMAEIGRKGGDEIRVIADAISDRIRVK